MENVLWLVAIVVGFFIFMQLFVFISGKLKKGKTIPDLKGDIGNKIKRGQNVLVYFYSPT